MNVLQPKVVLLDGLTWLLRFVTVFLHTSFRLILPKVKPVAYSQSKLWLTCTYIVQLWPFETHQASGDPQHKILKVKWPHCFRVSAYTARIMPCMEKVWLCVTLLKDHTEGCKANYTIYDQTNKVPNKQWAENSQSSKNPVHLWVSTLWLLASQ